MANTSHIDNSTTRIAIIRGQVAQHPLWSSALCRLIVVMLLGAACSGPTSSRVDTGEFGSVEIFMPGRAVNNFAIVYTDAAGLQRDDLKAVQALTATGTQVALIDTRETLTRLQKLNESCVNLPGSLEWISRNAQHQAGLHRYLKPLVFGRGVGANLVYATLAQAPPLSFAGGVSLGFTGHWPIHKPPCRLHITDRGDGSLLLTPDAAVRGHWLLAPGTADVTPLLQPFLEVATPLNADTGSPLTPNQVYPTAMTQLTAIPAAAGTGNIGDLPLIEVSKRSASGTLVVIYSGDGGWRDLDRTLGETLAQKDYAVVGIDALHYFWSRRSPEATSADLARLIEHYLAAWSCRRIVLVGYSFGAAILPFAYNRLPATLRQKVLLLSLLAPGRGASFEIHLDEWLTSELTEDALPTPPEVARIEPFKLQCLYGVEDSEETLCQDATMKDAAIIRTTGGHHFDADYPALADRIDQAIRTRLNPPVQP